MLLQSNNKQTQVKPEKKCWKVVNKLGFKQEIGAYNTHALCKLIYWKQPGKASQSCPPYWHRSISKSTSHCTILHFTFRVPTVKILSSNLLATDPSLNDFFRNYLQHRWIKMVQQFFPDTSVMTLFSYHRKINIASGF